MSHEQMLEAVNSLLTAKKINNPLKFQAIVPVLLPIVHH